MKRYLFPIITLILLFTAGSCQELTVDEAFDKGKTQGYNEGHQEGYADGFNAGYDKPKSGLLLFNDVNPNLWKTTYIISVITIIFSLLLVFRAVMYLNYRPSEWKKTLAKWLVLLVGMLVSYFIVPRINLIWFFDPPFNKYIAYLVCIAAIVGIYFLGKRLSTLVSEKRSDRTDVIIILLTSLFLWFITYIVINGQYLFGHTALFGHHLIICFAIGIIAFNINLLLQSEPTPEEDTNPILNHDEIKEK
ncbi:MAG: hypothetical protein GQ574_11390 [Crocinitomix sp.]|nr:hypothetical protein [Crocinitomix sp.]